MSIICAVCCACICRASPVRGAAQHAIITTCIANFVYYHNYVLLIFVWRKVRVLIDDPPQMGSPQVGTVQVLHALPNLWPSALPHFGTVFDYPVPRWPLNIGPEPGPCFKRYCKLRLLEFLRLYVFTCEVNKDNNTITS